MFINNTVAALMQRFGHNPQALLARAAMSPHTLQGTIPQIAPRNPNAALRSRQGAAAARTPAPTARRQTARSQAPQGAQKPAEPSYATFWPTQAQADAQAPRDVEQERSYAQYWPTTEQEA